MRCEPNVRVEQIRDNAGTIIHRLSRRHKNIHDIISGNNLDLSFSCIEDANLSGIELKDTIINHSNIYRCNLENAKLLKCNLFLSRVVSSNLSGIDLSYSTAELATFYDVNLCNSNFSGVNLLRTVFPGCILDGAKINFHKYTELKDILSIRLGYLPEKIYVEIMKRGCFNDSWALNNIEMTDNELMIEICKFKGWGIDKIKSMK